MINYFKMLLFYLLEFLGSFINLFSCMFHVYPSLDLGVDYLIFMERRRVLIENKTRAAAKIKKEKEATLLEAQAHREL